MSKIRKNAYFGTFTKEQRVYIHEKYEGHCAYCGDPIKLKDMQIDHIIPKADFEKTIKNRIRVPVFLMHLTLDDLNHEDNLNPSCRTCNKWKSSYHLELFRSELKEQIKRLNKYSANYRIAKKYGLVKETIKPIKFYFETFKNDNKKIKVGDA